MWSKRVLTAKCGPLDEAAWAARRAAGQEWHTEIGRLRLACGRSSPQQGQVASIILRTIPVSCDLVPFLPLSANPFTDDGGNVHERSIASRGGRVRTRPDLLRGDKAYSARGHRQELRRRGIKAVIPEPADQAGHRKRKGSDGGRPVNCDAEDYKSRNVVERAFNTMNNWRGLATRYDKHALAFRGGVVLAAILTWLR